MSSARQAASGTPLPTGVRDSQEEPGAARTCSEELPSRQAEDGDTRACRHSLCPGRCPLGSLETQGRWGPSTTQLQRRLSVRPQRKLCCLPCPPRTRVPAAHGEDLEVEEHLVSRMISTCVACLPARAKEPAPWDPPSARNNF